MPRLGSVATFCLLLAAAAAGCVALAGYGYSLGWWGLGVGFGLLPVGAYAGAGAGVLALIVGSIAAWRRRFLAILACAVAIPLAGGAVAVPLNMLLRGNTVPHIHDITTDTDNPPQFVALKPERDRSANGSAYGGADIAALQKQGYPGIAPLVLPLPPEQVIARAESVARGMGWQIAAAVPAEGRLEATDTTKWWGFKDDIVVRAAAAPGGSRVDIRSASRIGKSDLGVNAARIRRFAHELAKVATQSSSRQ